jgi:hypothetical protein
MQDKLMPMEINRIKCVESNNNKENYNKSLNTSAQEAVSNENENQTR